MGVADSRQNAHARRQTHTQTKQAVHAQFATTRRRTPEARGARAQPLSGGGGGGLRRALELQGFSKPLIRPNFTVCCQ